ncbi:ankyrin repeat domain-containing protein 54 [Drosophila tropicalis]|uniref:Ankyrin repeat domain-containing protein 54 n=1 Tax=Drosophila willistoni TaxID=7260 RepID=B4MN14_DROWI|nr:ankyrin repeat domain-containing protein 54 [Drosophila willistoni]XP_046868175.1 ankyrin repeat domain-containing protein 54 [Drosophila willistoni]EDW73570.1 uncharacterized protein Dwil_GK17619 [Drosophila willistoni]
MAAASNNELSGNGMETMMMPKQPQQQSQPQQSKGIMITPPPSMMPPTPTSSPNTHGEWPNFNPNNANAFHLSRDRGEHFALPHLPPLPMNAENLPSVSRSLKMRPRHKRRQYCSYGNIWLKTNERKLRTAASTCNIELLNRILEDGFNPNAGDEYNRSPLHLAACRGYIPIVQQLLKYGANPNVVDSLGNTPLHLAVISASSNNFNVVVRILLQGGASVHMYDRSNKTPLELAEAKLRLLRNRYDHPTPETAKILEDMCMLTTLILRYMVKQQRELEDLSALEQRLQNLSTSEDQEQVVSQTADELLASVERLSINNK